MRPVPVESRDRVIKCRHFREGKQDSTISVFSLGPDGAPRHLCAVHPRMPGDIGQRRRCEATRDMSGLSDLC